MGFIYAAMVTFLLVGYSQLTVYILDILQRL